MCGSLGEADRLCPPYDTQGRASNEVLLRESEYYPRRHSARSRFDEVAVPQSVVDSDKVLISAQPLKVSGRTPLVVGSSRGDGDDHP